MCILQRGQNQSITQNQIDDPVVERQDMPAMPFLQHGQYPSAAQNKIDNPVAERPT